MRTITHNKHFMGGQALRINPPQDPCYFTDEVQGTQSDAALGSRNRVRRPAQLLCSKASVFSLHPESLWLRLEAGVIPCQTGSSKRARGCVYGSKGQFFNSRRRAKKKDLEAQTPPCFSFVGKEN